MALDEPEEVDPRAVGIEWKLLESDSDRVNGARLNRLIWDDRTPPRRPHGSYGVLVLVCFIGPIGAGRC